MDWPLCTTRLIDQNFGMGITPEDLIMPFYNVHGTNYFRPWKLCTEDSKKDAGSTVVNEKEWFKITLDVQHFRPDDLKVKVNNNEVIIEGKHEERRDDYGFISRQFTRRYTLPRDCTSENVTSTLTSDGVLIIMAKKQINNALNGQYKVIPINMCTATEKTSKTEKDKQESAIEKQKIAEIDTTKITKTTVDKESDSKLKEDHCKLLKPELLPEATKGNTEKLLSQSRKETDELLKLISADKTTANAGSTGKLEEALGQCKTAIAELTEKKVGESCVTESASENTSFKCSMTKSETIQSQESSSFTSSLAATMKANSDKISDIVNDVISELKEAAEAI